MISTIYVIACNSLQIIVANPLKTVVMGIKPGLKSTTSRYSYLETIVSIPSPKISLGEVISLEPLGIEYTYKWPNYHCN